MHVALVLVASTAHADEGRFDAALFRPAIPTNAHDLGVVAASETIGFLSLPLALYSDLAVKPVSGVDTQLRLTLLSGIGITDWAEIAVAAPFVLFESGDTASSSAVGNIRISTKVAVVNRARRRSVRGFGLALAGFVDLPTGDVDAFASDGTTTGGVSIIADHRFEFGMLVAANAGIWFRPDRQWNGVGIGDMVTFGAAAEMPVSRKGWLTLVGEIDGNATLDTPSGLRQQVPVETSISLRWRWPGGLALTVGGGIGRGYGFGEPMGRCFASVAWQPTKLREQEEITRLPTRDENDPDHDGVIGTADKCPAVAGPPDNGGCPVPLARIEGGEIVMRETVRFAPDRDSIEQESYALLDALADALAAHREVHVLVEVHVGFRASDAYMLTLSERRARSIVRYLVDVRHVDPTRLDARGSTLANGKILFDVAR